MAMKIRILSLFVGLGIFFWLGAVPSPVFAKDCGLAKIEPDAGGQNWNASYCVSGTYDEIAHIDSVTAVCRAGPEHNISGVLGIEQNCSCHEENPSPGVVAVCGALGLGHVPPAVETTQYITIDPNTIFPDEKIPGNYYTCFTLTSLDRNMGAIDVKIRSSGKPYCYPPRTNVKVGNYSQNEHLQNVLARIPGVPTYKSSGDIVKGSIYAMMCPTGGSSLGIKTAIGCVPTDPTTLIFFLLKIGIGIAGGIAFLLILLGGFRILTSTGNPEKLNAGKELVGSAIAGLLLIIFSIFLLRTIGVDILGIPGFK